MRDAPAAHTGDRAEPLLEIAVERDDFRVPMSRLTRVHLEQQQVLRLNPNWIDCRFDSVRTNSPAATSISSESRDLRYHEHLAQTDARGTNAGLARPARASFKRGIRSTPSTEAPARVRTASRSAAIAPGRRQHVPVQVARSVKSSRPLASRNVRKRMPQMANKTPKRAAERRQQHAFRQQLADRRAIAPRPC